MLMRMSRARLRAGERRIGLDVRSGLLLVLVASLCAPSSPAQPSPRKPMNGRRSHGFVRGVYGRDASKSGVDAIKRAGFDSVTIAPTTQNIDALAAEGLRGLVWLGGYSKSSCSFHRDRRWVRHVVSQIAGSDEVLAYQIADEPNRHRCPRSPAQVRARSAFVKSLDPGARTYVTVSVWNGVKGFPYQHFVGTTDVMGLVVYPCSAEHGCRFGMISDAMREANRDGVPKYWAVVQIHGAPRGSGRGARWYRSPSARQLNKQLRSWNRSRMRGYFLYHWGEARVGKKRRHRAVLTKWNQRW
jgi:hypothetical protein